MSQISIEELKKTMPWRERVHPNGVVQMIDRNGAEVPLFVMTAFMQSVTAHMARDVAPKQPSA
jgi:hypothetical protein